MRTFVFTLLYSCIFLSVFSQEKQVRTDSKIVSVTVFLSGAQIERTAVADIPSGTSNIVLTGLSPHIEAQSIQVKGEGSFTILSVNRQSNFLEEQKLNTEIARLTQLRDEKAEKLEQEKNLVAVLKSEEEMLIKNQVVSGDNTGLDLVKLKQALDFQKSRMQDAKNQQLEAQKRIRSLEAELAKINMQISDVKGKASDNTSDVVVKVSSGTAQRGSFNLRYVVKNASWYPTYDLRAKDVLNPVEFRYKANVTQRSGEDWKNVKLILSSGDPSVGGNIPVLKPYFIGDGMYGTAQGSITSVTGKVLGATDRLPLPGVSIRVKGTSVGTTTNASGDFTLQLPADAQTLQVAFIGFKPREIPVTSSTVILLQEDDKALSEVVVAGYGKVSGMQIRGSAAPVQAKSVEVESKENQTNIQFDIRNPYTILSDGKEFTVDIARYEMPASYQYTAIPKLSADVFLTAKIADISKNNILSGEANIFFEGTFLGKTLIDTRNSKDTLNVSLGVDRNISVQRIRQNTLNEKQFIGSSLRATREFLIHVKNKKRQAVNLVIEDQIPVSNSGDISVERQELSGGVLNETTGKVTWTLALQSDDEKKLILRYQVRYPKNKAVNLE